MTDFNLDLESQSCGCCNEQCIFFFAPGFINDYNYSYSKAERGYWFPSLVKFCPSCQEIRRFDSPGNELNQRLYDEIWQVMVRYSKK